MLPSDVSPLPPTSQERDYVHFIVPKKDLDLQDIQTQNKHTNHL